MMPDKIFFNKLSLNLSENKDFEIFKRYDKYASFHSINLVGFFMNSQVINTELPNIMSCSQKISADNSLLDNMNLINLKKRDS